MQYTYHKTCSYTEKGKKVSVNTQFYQIGIYAIINNDPSLQLNLEPKDLVKIEKKLVKNAKLGKIKDLVFGPAITVSDESGLFGIVS